MKLVLENVQIKHRMLLMAMAKALSFKVSDVEMTEEEEDVAMCRAIELSIDDEDTLSPKESEDFIASLVKK